jgi:hypothetical protein
MKRVTTICIGMLFLTLSVSAQLGEKAEDISPLLNGETVPDAVLISTDSKSKMIYTNEKSSIIKNTSY